jgi:3-oxoacyl-[acyl-carrier-protein] synthase II
MSNTGNSSVSKLGKRRVVVTGMGAVTPLGNTVAAMWERLLAGDSGVGRIALYDIEGLACQIGGEVRDFNVEEWVSPREAAYMDRGLPFACAAAQEALTQSGILESSIPRTRIGCNVSTAVGGLNVMIRAHEARMSKGARYVSPLAVPFTITDMVCGYLSMQHGLKGPTHCIISACATSTDAIGDALMLIQSGRADAIITGGTENIVPTMMASFISARALSLTHNDVPETASRPFDTARDGFIMAEGAAVLVLEEREHALKRGAIIYGEVMGFGAASDAYHLSAPHPEGEGAEAAMQICLADAGLRPEQIGYVNAHATSTPLGDAAECKAIRRVFGDYTDVVPVSGTKGSTGHLLGAAGALEAVICLQALQTGLLPSTRNLDNPDPNCPVNHFAGAPRQEDIAYALSNSFGFGGHCASVLFGRGNV